MMGPLNAWDFGPTGDDEPEDQAALQAALDHAGAHGRDLYIPRGVYRITNTLLVPSGVRVFGDGARTILRAHGAAFAGLAASGGTVCAVLGSIGGADIVIEDLAVDLATHGTLTNGISFIPGSAYTGAGPERCAVRRCHVSGRPQHQYLIWSFNGRDMKVRDNYVDGGCVDFATFHDQNGIEIVGGSGAVVTGNSVRRCANFGIGAVALSGYVSGVDGAILDGNTIDGCGVGVSLGTATSATTPPQDLRNVIVAGNIIRGSNRYGVDVWCPTAGVKMVNVAVTGNVIDGGKVAVYLRGHAGDRGHRNVVVSGNISTGATTTSGADAAIAVTAFHGATVRDNGIADCAGAAVRVSFADDVTIAGNRIERSAGIGIAGTSSARLVVECNRLVDAGNNGATYSVGMDAMTDAAIVRNVFAQTGASPHILVAGTRGRVNGNISLATGGTVLGQNFTTGGEGTF